MQDDWIEFEGRIEPMEWGRSVYTILRLPEEVMQALGHPRRVEGEINEHPVNLAPTTAPVIEGAYLWTGKSLLDAIGLEVGETVEVRLRPADPDAVEVPEDVAAAIRVAGASTVWEALTPGKRRAALHQVTTAKRADTRARRIERLIADLG